MATWWGWAPFVRHPSLHQIASRSLAVKHPAASCGASGCLNNRDCGTSHAALSLLSLSCEERDDTPFLFREGGQGVRALPAQNPRDRQGSNVRRVVYRATKANPSGAPAFGGEPLSARPDASGRAESGLFYDSREGLRQALLCLFTLSLSWPLMSGASPRPTRPSVRSVRRVYAGAGLKPAPTRSPYCGLFRAAFWQGAGYLVAMKLKVATEPPALPALLCPRLAMATLRKRPLRSRAREYSRTVA